MKKLSLFVLLSVFVFCGCSNDDEEITPNNDGEETTSIVSFEGKLTEANSQFTTNEGTALDSPSPYFKFQLKDSKNLVEFDHYYASWGFGGGFTYTNKTDITTPGYGNISAIAGKGKFGTTYLIAFNSNENIAQITLLTPNKYAFKGTWITNSTYAYLAIKDGNDAYKNETKFEANDWFKLTATGYDIQNKSIGKVEMYLADYRNNQTMIVKDWVWFDMTPLDDAVKVEFILSSTDNGEYGMNTPSYFCMDGITLIEK